MDKAEELHLKQAELDGSESFKCSGERGVCAFYIDHTSTPRCMAIDFRDSEVSERQMAQRYQSIIDNSSASPGKGIVACPRGIDRGWVDRYAPRMRYLLDRSNP